MIILLNDQNDSFSKFFYFLPLITDKKEKINQFKSNVYLHATDILFEDLEKLSPFVQFDPKDLEKFREKK